MRGKTNIFKHVLLVAVAVTVMLAVGMTVFAQDRTFYLGEVTMINVPYSATENYNSNDYCYSYTAPHSGTFHISAIKNFSQYSDGRLTVYDGAVLEQDDTIYADFSGYQQIASMDITKTSYTDEGATVDIVLTKGETYYIRVNYADPAAPHNNYFAFIVDPASVDWCAVNLYTNRGTDEYVTQNIVHGYPTPLETRPFTDEWYASNSGLILAGWATSPDGAVVYADGAQITPAADQTSMDLYAVWYYALSFDANGGSGTQMPDMGIAPDVYVNLPDCTYTKDGSVFVFWSWEPDSAIRRLYPGDPYTTGMEPGPVTLYAHYYQVDSYEPLYQLSADSDKLYLDIYVPYVGDMCPTLFLDNVRQTPYRTGVVVEDKQYNVFSLTSDARCMTDTHELDIKMWGTPLFNQTISVRSYLQVLLNSGELSARYANAARAMLRYGAAAQLFFNYPNGVAEGNYEIANYLAPGAAISTLNDYTWNEIVPVDNIASAFSTVQFSEYYGMNLSFTDQMTFMIAFRTIDGHSPEAARLELLTNAFFGPDADIVIDESREFCIVRLDFNLLTIDRSICRVRNTDIYVSDYLYRVISDNSVDQNYRNLCRALHAYAYASIPLRS